MFLARLLLSLIHWLSLHGVAAGSERRRCEEVMKPEEREVGWSLKVGSKHPCSMNVIEGLYHVLNVIQGLYHILKSFRVRQGSFRRHFIQQILLNIITAICVKYVIINKEAIKVYHKRPKKEARTPVRSNKFNKERVSHYFGPHWEQGSVRL